jgi:hypothetical protein
MLGSRVGPINRIVPPDPVMPVIGNLVLWLDSKDNSTVLNDSLAPCIDGQKVAVWVDKSGNGYDLSQSIDTQRPTYNNNSIMFSFPDKTFLERAAFLSGQDFTIVSVSNNIKSGGEWSVVWGLNKSNQFLRYFSDLGGASYCVPVGYASVYWSYPAKTTPNNMLEISILRFSGTTLTFKSYSTVGDATLLNNAARVADFVYGNFTLGERIQGNQYHNGLINEIFVFSGSTSMTDMDNLASWLKFKWSM